MSQDLQAAVERLSTYCESLKRKPSVLLVDDSEDDLWLLEDMIRKEAIPMDTDATTIAAVAMSSLDQVKFDLMFLDLRMHPVSGVDILRSMPGLNKETPVVIMSGLSNGPLVDEAIKLGAWLHLQKPIKVDMLRKILSKVKL